MNCTVVEHVREDLVVDPQLETLPLLQNVYYVVVHLERKRKTHQSSLGRLLHGVHQLLFVVRHPLLPREDRVHQLDRVVLLVYLQFPSVKFLRPENLVITSSHSSLCPPRGGK